MSSQLQFWYPAYHFNYCQHSTYYNIKVTFNLRQLVMPRPKRAKGFAGDWLISNRVGQDYGESRLESKGNSCPIRGQYNRQMCQHTYRDTYCICHLCELNVYKGKGKEKERQARQSSLGTKFVVCLMCVCV